MGQLKGVSNQVDETAVLRRDVERLRAALEAAETGTFHWDIQGDAFECDRSLAQLLGIDSPEACADSNAFLSVIQEEDRAAVGAQLAALRTDAGPFETEFRIMRKSGAEHWIHARGKIDTDAGGTPAYLNAACIDVTMRRQDAQMLRERARLSALGADVGVALSQGRNLSDTLRLCTDAIVEHLHVAFARVWVISENGLMLNLMASSGIYTHTDGAHAQVPVGKFKIGLIAQEHAPHLTNDVLNDPRVGDKAWAAREGMVAFAGYPLLVEGRIAGVVALFSRRRLAHDTLDALASISNSLAVGIERKRGETALRASEARKASILQTALDCIITIDHESRILEFNEAAEKTFGYTAEQALGQALPELIIPPEFRRRHREGMARYLETGESAVLGKRVEIRGMRSRRQLSSRWNLRRGGSRRRGRRFSRRRFGISPSASRPSASCGPQGTQRKKQTELKAISWRV